ncbi:MAG: T9SS type A sorting domain-containing protein, partial [Phaeodactylibacter sp.]|nr:T9SS type A sorting domain-containing protein [Phaeodactylibacter sp.]
GECLIENNVFKRLRHSMILQAGANGNVFSYNYSTDPYWTEVGLPPNSAGDIVLHGNFPYSNLFEGNIAQNIVLDDSHGEQGPYNTFFRNRAEGFGILMSAVVPTDKQNFIGNEVTGGLGLFYLSGDNHFSYGNNVLGQILPNPITILDDTTYYSSAPEHFYLPGDEETPIGIPNTIDEPRSNTAKERYELGMPVHCEAELPEPPPPNPTAMETVDNPEPELLIAPNPCRGSVLLDIGATSDPWIREVQVFNMQGQLLQLHSVRNAHYRLDNLPAGLLLIQVQLSDGEVFSRRLLVLIE